MRLFIVALIAPPSLLSSHCGLMQFIPVADFMPTQSAAGHGAIRWHVLRNIRWNI
jgi:hypothetical protein